MIGPTRTVAVWVATAAVAALFLLAAAGLLFHGETTGADFSRWGYVDWFRYIVAAVEVAGAVLLFVPRLAWAGAAALGAVAAGCVWTHLSHNDPEQSAVPILLFCSLLTLFYLRWPRAVTRSSNPPAAH